MSLVAQTRQKTAIFSALRRAGRPLTRDEILARARTEVPRLGAATVDRTIREATKGMEMVGVEFPGQPRRYELPSAKGEHPHFICRTCGLVYDLPIAMKLPKVELPKGFVLTGGEVIYAGICKHCAEAEK